MIMHDIHDKSSLISRLFKFYTIPEQPFDPQDEWEHKYYGLDTFLTISEPKQIAKRDELKITRKNSDNGMSKLNITSDRYCCSEFFYFVDANLQCYNNEISTPKSWRYQSKVAKKRSDSPYFESGLTKEFNLRNDKLFIKTNGISTQLNLNGAYTCKWCLLDAAQRMLKSSKKSVNLMIFDEYNSINKDQIFRYRESAKIESANSITEVLCFEHLGNGTVPATYWVDKSGRLLFYLSGIELLILGEENGQELISLSSLKEKLVKN